MSRFIVLAAIIASACAGAVLSQVVIPPAHAAVTQRWEHFCFTGANYTSGVEASSKKLNDAGAEGWELVTSAVITVNQGSGSGVVYCMKRPAP